MAKSLLHMGMLGSPAFPHISPLKLGLSQPGADFPFEIVFPKKSLKPKTLYHMGIIQVAPISDPTSSISRPLVIQDAERRPLYIVIQDQ